MQLKGQRSLRTGATLANLAAYSLSVKVKRSIYVECARLARILKVVLLEMER